MALPIRFKLSEVATVGDQASSGLPAYATRLSAYNMQVKLENEKRDCVCTALVLGLLTLLAATASLTLFVYSTGFTDHQFIVLGAAVGVASVSFCISGVVRFRNFLEAVKKTKTEFQALLDTALEPKEILEKMVASEATPDHIEATLGRMKGEDETKREGFVGYVYQHYSTLCDSYLLDEDHQKVLHTIVNAPIILPLQIDQYHRAIALGMLEGFKEDINRPKALSENKHTLIQNCVQHVYPACSKEEVIVLARYPVELAQMILSEIEVVDVEPMFPLIAGMTHEQKVDFLKALRKNWRGLSEQQKKGINGVIQASLHVILTPQFVAQFSSSEEGSFELIAPSSDVTCSTSISSDSDEMNVLLKELAHWPRALSTHMHSHRDLLTKRSFVHALFEPMGRHRRKRYTDAGLATIQTLGDRKAVELIKVMLNTYGHHLPAPIAVIYSKFPRLMAAVCPQLVDAEVKEKADKIILQMSESDQLLFFGDYQEHEAKHPLSTLLKGQFTSLAASPTVSQADYSQHSPDFALHLLQTMGLSQEGVTGDLDHTALCSLISHANRSTAVDKEQIFAQYPVAIALLAQTDTQHFNSTILIKIISFMNDGQKALFVDKITADQIRARAIVESKHDEITDEEEAAYLEALSKMDCIRKTIEAVMPSILTVDFAFQFTSQEQPIPEEASTLLISLTYWPEVLSTCMHQHGDLLKNVFFTRTLLKEMGEQRAVKYTDAGVVAIGMLDHQEAALFIATILDLYGDHLPAPIAAIYSKFPQLMATVRPLLQQERAVRRADEIVLEMMHKIDQLLFFAHYKTHDTDKPPLSPLLEKRFTALASSSKISQIDPIQHSPDFSLDLLRTMSKEKENKKSIDEATLCQLISHANGSTAPDKEEIFAQHPVLIAVLAQSNSQNFTSDVLVSIIPHMNDVQKALFLEKMGADWAELREGAQEFDNIRKIIEAVMPSILTVDFAFQFTSQEQSIPDKAFTILKQLIHFPEAISNVMHQTPALMINGLFVTQLFDAMNATQIGRYVAHSVAMIKGSKEQQTMVGIISKVWHVYRGELPTPLIEIYQQLPIPIAQIFPKLSEALTDKMLKTVIFRMSVDHQVIFLERVDEKRELTFAQLLANGSCAPATYLNQHPEEFGALMLNNHNIQTSAHDNDAIKILAGMSVSSMKQSIHQMDYENYNKLVAALRIQLNNFSTNGDVPQALAQLAACFRYAPDNNPLLVPKEKFVNSTSLFVTGFARVNRLTDGPWRRFIEIAESQEEAVWQ